MSHTLFSFSFSQCTQRLCLLVLALSLCACAKPQSVGTVGDPAPLSQSDAVWQRYETLNGASVAEATLPFRLQLSLRYGSEGDTRRVTALLWGNSTHQLRLDVNAGVGVTIAKILEDGDHFLVFAPGEKRAFFHQGRQKPLLNVGVPMPLGVGQLAQLLNGQYATVFGLARAPEAFITQRGNLRYTLEAGRLAGQLTLNAQGLPQIWQGSGWTLNLSYDDGQSLPHKLEMQHTQSQKKAIVLVKERNTPPAPFTEAQMRLTLPEGTPVLPLSQFKQGS